VADQFWNRRVLVTGHTGFKGGWLAMWLRELGAQVSGYALAPESPGGIFSACELEGAIDSRIGDIRDRECLRGAFEESQPEIVFHLAAQPLVRRSYCEPLATLETNAIGTANVLEAVRHTPSVRAVVVVTSDKCYENPENAHAFRESDRLGGADPYSASKGCAEIVAHAWRRSFLETRDPPVALATARAGNVIGGGDFAEDRIVPDAIRAFSHDQVLSVRNPGAIRPWQHVLEPLSGYLALARALIERGRKFSGAWNFGPQDSAAATVAQLVELLSDAWGGARWRVQPAADGLAEARMLSLDTAKARKRLGWRPRLSIREAVDLTVEWYRAAPAVRGPRLYDLSVEQVRRYCRIGEAVAPDARRGTDVWP
jgi:CDP-glucose 4,6-dehydratase